MTGFVLDYLTVLNSTLGCLGLQAVSAEECAET
jgi:hypothetical protein